MTKKEYNQSLKIAEEQIENQDYIFVEDFKKNIIKARKSFKE